MTVGSIKRYLNVPELADYIDSTDGTVRQLVHQRRIPFMKVAGGRRILFDIQAIDAWLMEQSVEPLEGGERMRNQRESPTHRQQRIAMCSRIDRAVAHLQTAVSRYGDWDRVPYRTKRLYYFLLHERSFAAAAAHEAEQQELERLQ